MYIREKGQYYGGLLYIIEIVDRISEFLECSNSCIVCCLETENAPMSLLGMRMYKNQFRLWQGILFCCSKEKRELQIPGYMLTRRLRADPVRADDATK